MIALGICDDRDGAAALVIDEALWGVLAQPEVDRQRDNIVFPSGAVDALLADAGLHAQDVDRIVFGGAMTPNTFRRLRSAAIPGVQPSQASLARAILRRSGLHMLDADLARSILQKRMRAHGLSKAEVELEEIHGVLAYAAYATQPEPEALVLVAHPRGDGLALSVWNGEAGQLDCLFNQSELACIGRFATHVATELGWSRWDAARARQGATPDLEVVARLRERIRFPDGRFKSAARGQEASFWAEMRRQDGWEGIAHALAVVNEESLLAWTRQWRERTGQSALALAGDLFDDGVLLSALAQLDGVRSVWMTPGGAARARAMGAVLGAVGAAPAAFETAFLGIAWSEQACAAVLKDRGLAGKRNKTLARSVAKILDDGGAVAIFRGRGEMTEHPFGHRVVATAPDHPRAGTVELVSNASKAPPALRPLLRFATWSDPSGVRPLVPTDPFWNEVLSLSERGVRFGPFLDAGGVRVFSPAEAVDAFQSQRLDALVLEDRIVRAG